MNGTRKALAAVAFVLLSAAATATIARSQAGGAPLLAGSIFKIALGDKHSIPVVGADVYLHPAGTTDPDAWLGPNLTDVYGRFTFYNVPQGRYLLRIYSGTLHLWEQVVELPATLQPIVIRDVRVVYYPKAIDGGKVDLALQASGLPYERVNGSVTQATNMVWFGDNVALSDVKTLTKALLSAGVQIRAVRRFAVGNDWRAKVIEIGSSPSHVADPPLSVAALNSATDFPRAHP
jgi:hypothetical protein